MIYELHFHPLALKKWKKLSRELQEQFKKQLRRRDQVINLGCLVNIATIVLISQLVYNLIKFIMRPNNDHKL